MDFLMSAVLAFLGASALFAYFSKSFERKGFQAFFFSMSMIFLMGCFVTLLSAPNIQERVFEQANTTSEIVNRTTTVVLPTNLENMFGGQLTIMIWSFFFIIAIFVFYFVVDTMKFFGKTAEGGE